MSRTYICDGNLGDEIDPKSQEYQHETALKESAEAEKARIAALTAAQLAAEKEKAAIVYSHIATLNTKTLLFNAKNPPDLPLKTFEKQMQTAVLAGDFLAMSKILPFSIHRWNSSTPLGKYRFKIIGGKRVYIPFSDADIDRFMQGSWILALVEPGVIGTIDRVAKAKQFKEGQAAHKKKYPATDWRHVYPIYPGAYIYQVYKPSTWVKIRTPVIIAAATVAAIYLGPIVAAKIAPAVTGEGSAAIVGGATKAGAVATKVTTLTKAGLITAKAAPILTTATATTAVTASKLLTTVKSGVDLVNKARTVNAIIKGELPPPPISLTGSSFTDWAMNIAKEEIIREAKDQAAELGMEYIQKKMTAAEEAKLRAEIIAMQNELAKLVPPGTVIEPSSLLDAQVRAKIAEMQRIEKEREQMNMILLAGAAGVALLVMG